MSRTFDPITLEILWRRLISIVDEADSSVARTAFSVSSGTPMIIPVCLPIEEAANWRREPCNTRAIRSYGSRDKKTLSIHILQIFYKPGDILLPKTHGHWQDISMMSAS